MSVSVAIQTESIDIERNNEQKGKMANINIFFIWLSFIVDAECSKSSSAAKDFIISDLNEKGKIIWVPSEDINKSEVKPSDYVEEKLGGKSIKQVAYKFYKESKKHGIIYFLILLPFLQFVLRL